MNDQKPKEVVDRTPKELSVPTKIINLTDPRKMVEFASTVKKFIVEQKLFENIQGKNYVKVEGWQFAGALTGTVPIVRSVVRVEGENKEIKYRAEVELVRVTTGKQVGYGVAYCSNLESKRRGADEYVIASMAQTRATGKAYRNVFGWLVKVAGYETTPAEEIDIDAEQNKKDREEKIKSAVEEREKLDKVEVKPKAV